MSFSDAIYQPFSIPVVLCWHASDCGMDNYDQKKKKKGCNFAIFPFLVLRKEIPFILVYLRCVWLTGYVKVT